MDTPTASDAGYFPDLLIEEGKIQPKSPWDIAATSCGQFSLQNAARVWTYLWLIVAALGCSWTNRSPSSHPVRMSFKHGKGSFFDGLISNPRFYEMNMGWPIGWTAPEEPVTEFAVWLQRMRSELSQMHSIGSHINDA